MGGYIREASDEYHAPGYVLDTKVLGRVVDAGRELVGESDVAVEIIAHTRSPKRQQLRFTSVDALQHHIDREVEVVHELDVEVRSGFETGMSASFGSEGDIAVKVFGAGNDFAFRADRVFRAAQQCVETYGWWIRSLAFNQAVRGLVAVAALCAAGFLIANVGYYYYARSAGVNIDPNVLPPGNVHFRDVERALASDSLSVKLDVLLAGELRGFKNVTDIMARSRAGASVSGGMLAFFAASAGVLKVMRGLYPRAYFALGTDDALLERLRKRRELWNVGVVVAFAVNVAAGAAVGLLIRLLPN